MSVVWVCVCVHGPAGQHYEVCMIEDEGSFCSSADYSYYHPSRPTCSLSGELLEAALFPEITPLCVFVCVCVLTPILYHAYCEQVPRKDLYATCALSYNKRFLFYSGSHKGRS